MTEEKFNKQYRNQSARAQWWDYRNNGAYFITICTAYKEHSFGNIVSGNMQLSSVGIIADIFWHEIKKHVSFVNLGEFVVMPNHIHGILIINQPLNNENIVEPIMPVETSAQEISPVSLVGTRHALSLQTPQTIQTPQTPGQKRFQNQGNNSVSSIIGSYKSVVTRHTNRLGYDFAWQTRFHDHIIRNNDEYQRIANYIIKNPQNWNNDRYNDNRNI